ncbi:hypothetical protein MCEMRE26_00144 [Candidatus Nanopelagicaceae bacterium]
MADNACKCSPSVRNSWGTEKNSSGEIVCSFCEQLSDDLEQRSGVSVEPPRPALPTRDVKKIDQIQIGLQAADRTEKYSTLFENIGKIMQILNSVGAVVLLIAGFFIDAPGFIKFIYWVVILIVWAFAYVQTSLIRGLASYFQMKASDHLLRYQNQNTVQK